MSVSIYIEAKIQTWFSDGYETRQIAFAAEKGKIQTPDKTRIHTVYLESTCIHNRSNTRRTMRETIKIIEEKTSKSGTHAHNKNNSRANSLQYGRTRQRLVPTSTSQNLFSNLN